MSALIRNPTLFTPSNSAQLIQHTQHTQLTPSKAAAISSLRSRNLARSSLIGEGGSWFGGS